MTESQCLFAKRSARDMEVRVNVNSKIVEESCGERGHVDTRRQVAVQRLQWWVVQ